jgi:hypothetical protein
MSYVLRRLRKLEAQLMDDTGLVPRSPEWYNHWLERIRRYMDGGTSVDIRGATVELVRLYMRECDDDEEGRAAAAQFTGNAAETCGT